MENHHADLLTFDKLPLAITTLTQEVKEVKALLLERPAMQQDNAADCWLSLTELCNYHPDKPKKHTVYLWVHTRKIPVHKSGKKLRFLKSEIDLWLKQGKKKTFEEIQSEAEQHSAKNKKGLQ
jgi:excisionase family DNA binding protein